MPRIEESINQVHGDKGYVGLGVHVGDDVAFAAKVRAETGITYPMVIDYDNVLLHQYARVGTAAPLFPLAYLIDKGGNIAEIYTTEEPPLDELSARVGELLAE